MLLVQRNADARVSHAEMQQPLLRMPHETGFAFIPCLDRALSMRRWRDLHHHLTRRRELHRITDQIHENLPQPSDIADKNFRDGILHVVGEIDFFLRRLHRQQLQRLLDASMNLKRMMLQFQLARFDLREVEDVVDDREQRVRTATNSLHVFALFVGEICIEQKRDHADHTIHRRANFVTHVRQER